MRIDYIQQIAEALQAPTKNAPVPVETILVCPSRAEGRRLISAVTAQGSILVGVRPETPSTLAKELCAAWLSEPDAPRLIEEVEGAELVRSCMGENAGVFSGVNAKTLSATRAIFRTLQEMTMAGVPLFLKHRPELAQQPKLEALQELREAYHWKKCELNLIDRADLLTKAIEFASEKQDSYLHRTHYVALNDYAPTFLERQLLEQLTKDLRVVELPCADYMDPETEKPFLPWGAVTQQVEMRLDAVKQLQQSDSRFVACRGVETEVRFPLRDILDKKLNIEDCAVVYLSGSYALPLYEEAARFNIPITIGGGLPLMSSLLYTTLCKVSELPLSDFYAEDVCKLVSFGGLSPENRGGLAEHLRRKKVGWGRERYLPAMKFEPQPCPDGADEAAWKLSQTKKQERLAHWEECLQLLLAVAAGDGDVKVQRETLLKFLPFCNHASQREAAAHAKVKDLLKQIVNLEDGETVLSRLLHLMETATYLNGKTEPGKLYCAPLRQAVCTGRKHLYILGFSRYAVQGRRSESPILLDAEREALNGMLDAMQAESDAVGRLQTTAQQGREQEFRLLQLLVRHGGDFVLTYPDFDSAKMLDQMPAPFFKEASRGKVEKVTYLPEKPLLSVDDLITRQDVKLLPPKARKLPDCQPVTLRNNMTRKEQMQKIPFSATMLEEAARCPYAFYLRRLLKIRAPQPVTRNPEKWLNAAEIGTFCHVVLEDYYTPGQTKSVEDLFEEAFPALKEEVPMPRPELEQETKDQLLTMLQRAVAWVDGPENQDGYGRKVLATEKWFQDLPMDFANRWTLQMQGSIDRVDELANGDIGILDYKTGNPQRHKDEQHKHWQHYLYARAQETLDPNCKVTHAGYFFLHEDAKDDEMLLRITEDDAQRSECALRIAWVLDQAADDNWLPKCLPRYEPYKKLPKDKPLGAMKNNITGRSVDLGQCKNWCEFASICPEQEGGFDND